MRSARAVWLGRRRYEPIHALQKRLVEARQAKRIGDVILLLEHEPVITLGRAAEPGNVLHTPEVLAERGVDLVETGRGGDVTYHGPGQLVCYPLLDLRPDHCDVRRYVRGLAEVMILIARAHHVEAGVVDGMIGAWVDRLAPAEWGGEAFARELAKVGAIGVRISRWITMHGFALNLAVDLDAFGLIVPCGIKDYAVTSVHALTGRRPEVRATAFAARAALAEALELEVSEVEDLAGVEDLDAALIG
ncbi:Octanoate-[acyl-carrier-protein]-protein-N-octanoyltransferase [Minicystis rosea]|nr:Octanoate-[acyl-carrier-protein]-protein-N-octanoyltransferase [Minicystis rosea]